MSSQGWLWEIAGWAALPLVACVAFACVYRRQVAQFPLFFSYLVVTEAVGILRLAATGASARLYHDIYWISDIVYSLFALTATYELFVKRLFVGFHKVRIYRYLFVAAALLVTALVIAIAVSSGHARVLAVTIQIYNFVRAAMLVFFILLILVMGREWSRLEFGVALGFGLDVSTSLMALGLWSRTPGNTLLMQRLSVLSYDAACIIWLYCFLTAPRLVAAPTVESLPTETLREARKWAELAKDLLTPTKRPR